MYLAETMYPEADRITFEQDNLCPRKPSALHKIHAPERARAIAWHLDMVNTLKHGSWINLAEIELSLLMQQRLSDRVPDIADPQGRKYGLGCITDGESARIGLAVYHWRCPSEVEAPLPDIYLVTKH
jgi:hypothetical protein